MAKSIVKKSLNRYRAKGGPVINDVIPEIDSRQPVIPIVQPPINQPVTRETAIISIYDRFSSHPSYSLTPRKLADIVREADTGEMYRIQELFEEIMEKDARIMSDWNKVKSSIIRKNYSIISPDSDDEDQNNIREDVDKMIKGIRGWKSRVANIADCYLKQIAINEIFWIVSGNKYNIADIRWRHQKRFRYAKTTDPYSDPDDLRLLVDPRHIDLYQNLVTPEDLSECVVSGISLEKYPIIRSRFIISRYDAKSGHGNKNALMRPIIYLWMFKNFGVQFWLQYIELLLGYRIGHYDPNNQGQKEIVEQAIKGLASDAAAVISNDSKIEFVTLAAASASSHQAYKELKDYADSAISEVILGNEGTTKSTPGRLGGEQNAKEVTQEIIEGLASVVDEAITDDLIKPYIIYNYGLQEEYPFYQTDISANVDLTKEVQVDGALQNMGAKFYAKDIQERYGRNLANGEDDILTPIAKVAGVPDTSNDESSALAGKIRLLLK